MSLVRLAVVGIMVPALTGCECIKEKSFTGKLWTNDEFRHFRGVATNQPVAVYHVPSRHDYLIAYTEVRDGDDRPRARAFFLCENADLLATHRKPRFASTNVAGLVPIPTENDTVVPRANVRTNIIVYAENGVLGPYPLVEYESSKGTATKVALTPLAVTGDVGIVSLVAAIAAAFAFAHCGGCIPTR